MQSDFVNSRLMQPTRPMTPITTTTTTQLTTHEQNNARQGEGGANDDERDDDTLLILSKKSTADPPQQQGNHSEQTSKNGNQCFSDTRILSEPHFPLQFRYRPTSFQAARGLSRSTWKNHFCAEGGFFSPHREGAKAHAIWASQGRS